MFCVWQVVKTPTIISNNPVYIYMSTNVTINCSAFRRHVRSSPFSFLGSRFQFINCNFVVSYWAQICATDNLFVIVRVNYLQFFFFKSCYVKRAVNEVSDKRAVNEVSDKRRTKRISAEVLYGFLFSVCQCYPDIQYHNWKTFVSLNMFNNSSQ